MEAANLISVSAETEAGLGSKKVTYKKKGVPLRIQAQSLYTE